MQLARRAGQGYQVTIKKRRVQNTRLSSFTEVQTSVSVSLRSLDQSRHHRCPRRRPLRLVAVAALVLLLAFVGLRILRPSGSSRELFRTGSVARVTVVGPRAFVTFFGTNIKAAVVELGTGRVVRHPVPAYPLVDAGQLRTTSAEVIGPINAANLRRAHAQIETGRTIGKVVLEAWS